MKLEIRGQGPRGCRASEKKLTPWNKVFLEKLIIAQRIKNFNVMYGIRRAGLVNTMITVLWDVAPCSLVDTY
jgi:hypothetical protein